MTTAAVVAAVVAIWTLLAFCIAVPIGRAFAVGNTTGDEAGFNPTEGPSPLAPHTPAA